MSLFTVAVFHYPDENLDAKLERYRQGTYNPNYLEFEPYESREGILEYLRERNDVRTFEEYVEKHGYIYDEASDSYGHMRNPNARFDYCGRRRGSLRIKPEYVENAPEVDSAPLAWVDTSPDPEEYRRAIREWELIVEKKPVMNNEKTPFSLFGAKYYIEQYKTKENFAKSEAVFHTHALVTPGGEWIEQGKMGRWGMDSATYESRNAYNAEFEKIIEELRNDPDIWITILTCHI